ncbi:GTP 3',8-cyclase MoaA [Geobacter sp. DSM 9736]|uniref:GTP 3',8-cyclase MoaA n=1 Tax=Geobacter sp. DSM 9736 TaxID=1277350 RepID=UPI000B4FE53F|nr:GTP 3',8-cyclase MoaA [Geobacter sp. DSM 9736]SNB46004.1 cyclic pyranopterin monophosphate synthase subunit MoaA [Geobacter sp. DSM 9736]
MSLRDNCGRKINYLRLSITDRCNLRCTYCMPAGGVTKLFHSDILSYEELVSVAEAAVAIGIEKIRVTGGEPLVRRGVCSFLSKLSRIEGLRQLVLTTNGLLLEEMAGDLKEAGVQRLNISLDSLRPEVFAHITRGGDLSRVLAGISAAGRAGFPLKINMVVMRGVNDGELADFAALTLERPCTVRFIEYMPAARTDNVGSLLLPGDRILAELSSRFSLEPVERGDLGGPAREFRIKGGRGALGIITPISRHFCDDCNRIRVTSAGVARSCLFGTDSVDLKPFLHAEDRCGLDGALRRLVSIKGRGHCIGSDAISHSPFAMSGIGG